jgi:lysozyme
MIRNVVIGLVAVILVGSVLTYLLFTGWIRFNYPSLEEFPVRGIDISHHQGKISWEKLKAENISFVIIKATEGQDYKDPLFTENWNNSKQAGYQTGAYHFYRFCKDGKVQANNFIETVPNQPDNLPPTIDLEFGGNCNAEKTKEQITQEITEFLELLEFHYKKKPIIYVTREFYDSYLVGNFNSYPIWMRDIFRQPNFDDGREWFMWQFANRGHLEGIEGYVDLNVVKGKFE